MESGTLMGGHVNDLLEAKAKEDQLQLRKLSRRARREASRNQVRDEQLASLRAAGERNNAVVEAVNQLILRSYIPKHDRWPSTDGTTSVIDKATIVIGKHPITEETPDHTVVCAIVRSAIVE